MSALALFSIIIVYLQAYNTLITTKPRRYSPHHLHLQLLQAPQPSLHHISPDPPSYRSIHRHFYYGQIYPTFHSLQQPLHKPPEGEKPGPSSVMTR